MIPLLANQDLTPMLLPIKLVLSMRSEKSNKGEVIQTVSVYCIKTIRTRVICQQQLILKDRLPVIGHFLTFQSLASL